MDMRVKCKQCGRFADAKEFVLDHGYKMMVCPHCVKDRQLREQVHRQVNADKFRKQKEEEERMRNKPAGWDAEDDYLEKAWKNKLRSTVQVEKVDYERVKYPCPKCKYTFTYNVEKKTPQNCPMCGNPVTKMRF